MTLAKLALSLGLIAAFWAGFALYVQQRAARHEARIDARFAPQGRFVSIDGARVHYLEQGAGEAIVLIHGASGNALDLATPLMAELAKTHRVIAFDRPGLGWSDPIPNEASLTAQALHLAKAAQAIGVQNPVLVGQSYGGSVALAWALEACLPPRALVLISAPSLPWPGKLDIWYRITTTAFGRAVALPLATAFLPQSYLDTTITGIFAPDAVPEAYSKTIAAALALRRASLQTNVIQVNGLRAEVVAMAPRYSELSLPVELLHGMADSIVPARIHSIPLAERLPNARLTLFETTGHMPHYSHSAAVLAAIERAALR